jgi:spore coat polysaccharide biosynthesis protein SpsF
MITAIILCRSQSSRLKNKHLKKIGSKTLLEIIIHKINKIKIINEIIISTGKKKDNYRYEEFLIKKKIKNVKFYYHYNNHNVVERIHETAKNINNKYSLIISGDCIIIDRSFIERIFFKLLDNKKKDFVILKRISNKKKVLYEGFFLFKTKAWVKIYLNSKELHHLEHPGSVIRSKNLKFKILKINPLGNEIGDSKIRLSIDTKSDLQFFQLLYNKYKNYDDLNLVNIKNNIRFAKINRHVIQRKINKNYSKEVIIITTKSKKYGLGHYKRSLALARHLTETITSNVKIFLIENQRVDINRYNFTIFKDRIFNKNIILDLPEYLLKKYNFFIKNNKSIVIDSDLYKNNTKTIIPSLTYGSKHGISGIKYLIINRDIFFLNLLNPKKKNDVIILSGGSGIPPRHLIESLRSRNYKKIILVIGPYVSLKKINYLKNSNIKIIINPNNVNKLIKESKIVITRFGTTVYDAIAMNIKPIVWISGENKSRTKDIQKLSNIGIIHIFKNRFPKVKDFILKDFYNFNNTKYILKEIKNYFNI